MKEFNEIAIKMIILDMVKHNLADKGVFEFINNVQFLKAFYVEIEASDNEEIKDRYNAYCTDAQLLNN